MAGHDVDKRLTQRGFIHRIKETDGEWQIEDFVVAEGLVDLPQGVLRQRQRRLNRLPLCLRGKLRCARFRHCLTFGVSRQSTGGRVAEQIVNVEFDAVQAEQAADNPGSHQRVPAAIEEIFIGGHLRCDQRVTEFRQDQLGNLGIFCLRVLSRQNALLQG
ncbi:hypothetical protein D3C71_1749990 [compost metagenome]